MIKSIYLVYILALNFEWIFWEASLIRSIFYDAKNIAKYENNFKIINIHLWFDMSDVKACEPKWVNSKLDITGFNSLRLGGLQVIFIVAYFAF